VGKKFSNGKKTVKDGTMQSWFTKVFPREKGGGVQHWRTARTEVKLEGKCLFGVSYL